jgi:hypothetical protein
VTSLTTEGGRRAAAPLVVELAVNAPPAVLAAVEAAIGAVAPLATVELVRVRAGLPSGDTIRLSGSFIEWNAPASAWRRQERVLAAFAAAFDSALAVASDGGGHS